MKKRMGTATHQVECTINGERKTAMVPTRLLLSDFLRDTLGLTGTHVGCEHGVCGACTVLIDGESARSCLVFAVQVDGGNVETVEGLSKDRKTLTDLQQAFQRHHALQCGFCTPGMLISSEQFLQRQPQPSERDVRDMLSGHLCRCTGYQGIVDAILDVSAERCAVAPQSDD